MLTMTAGTVFADEETFENEPQTGNFGPADPLARQDFAVILWRFANEQAVESAENTFPDVANDGYYLTAVLWAKENEVIMGYDSGYFGVGDNITREQVATILYRFAKDFLKLDVSEAEAAGDLSQFSDEAKVSEFAKQGLTWANGAGIVKGKDDGTIDPTGNATHC